tara:strand:+ start:691 stop:1164 length:474 start_codon:yes stop_codon:yes gene_type:complete
MNFNKVNIYNNLINLARNKNLFINFTKKDTFSDRILIFLFHLGFFLRNYKSKNNKEFLQSFYDYTFRQIELSIREIGYGDATINKKMKIYVNIFHSIINEIDSWNQFSDDEKFEIIKKYIYLKNNDCRLVKYFDKYVDYLSKMSLNSFTKSVIDHRF